MKLLIITQKVDKEDQILGFFHNWIYKLSKEFESLVVVCLEKGVVDLPSNVKVFSLGKENTPKTFLSKIKYIKNFFGLIFGLNDQYDSVFVHMNQEYVLLGGWFWKIRNKKIFMWRNHPVGNIFTRIAVFLSDKVFCTSTHSFTAKFKKTEIMPVGIDTEIFKSVDNARRNKKSILFLGRISPIKNPHILVEALNILNKKGVDFRADFYGDSLPKDQGYFDSIKNKVKNCGLEDKVNFFSGVPNYKTPEIYASYEIFINLTPSGSFDKTILEACSCGCVPLVLNEDFNNIDKNLVIESLDKEDVAKSIEKWLYIEEFEREKMAAYLAEYVEEKHSLRVLVEKLSSEINLK
jgi:glycosyltransferase involved in cell wall biosynthesis